MNFDNIKKGLAGIYYSLEDRYYAMLDWLDSKGIPVYKIIDPIDEAFPSFVLFCLIILFLALGIIWILFFSQPYYSVSVKVIELDSKKPISGVSVDYNYYFEGSNDKISKTARTGSDGSFIIENLSGVLVFEFSVKKEGFEDFKNQKPVKVSFDSSSVVLSLKKKIILPEGKNIVVKDASVQPSKPINGVNIKVSFSCSSGKIIPEKTFSYYQIEALTPSEIKECGDAIATVTVNGFVPTALPLTATTTVFELLKETPPEGSFKVIVKDSGTRALLKGIKLLLFKVSFTTSLRTELSDEAGSFVFSLPPGKYFVKAIDDINHSYDDSTSEIVEVESGERSEVIILMNRTIPSEVKSLKFKVVDANGNVAIPRAEIYFSSGGLLNDTPLITDDDGKARYDNARNGIIYYARVKSAGFVTKFQQVFPSERNDENYNIIRLEKSTALNSGKVRVFVNDEENSVIEGAEVQLINTNFESLPLFDITNETGLADFDNESLPAGNYYAFADKRSIDANGSEGPKRLNAGMTLDFNVMLVAGIANIKVKVVNENNIPVSDANVLFYSNSSDSNYSFSKVSSTDGSTETIGFKVNKHPKIVVSKPGFLPSTIIVYNLHRASVQNPIIVQVTLYSENYASEFLINFAFVSKPESPLEELPASQQKILADKTQDYGMVFDIIVPKSQTQNNVKAHVRTDLDSILNEASARMVVRSASPEKSPIRSANYNPSNPFSDQNIVENVLLDAKQVNLSFGNLSTGVYRFYSIVKVKSVPRNTMLELHYTAKSDSKTLGDFKKTFTVGASFCKTNCPNFEYLFEIARIIDNQQENFITVNSIPASPRDLNYNIDYLLRYTVWNTSKNNITQNFDINFSTNDEALVFGNNSTTSFSESIIPETVSQLAPNASVQNFFKIKGVKKTTTQMKVNLNLGIPDDNTAVAFKISAEDLILSVPQILFSNTFTQDFTVIVADKNTGMPVQNALVQIKASNTTLTPETFNNPLQTSITDSRGQALFRLNQAFNSSYRLFVSASAPGYNKAFTSIPFSSVFGNLDDFPCVNFKVLAKQCSFDENKICFNSTDSTPASFKITTNDCPEPVSISLRGGFKSNDTIVEIPLSIPEGGDISRIELSETDESKLINASKNPLGILGQFPITARITGKSSNFTSTKELIVYIGFPQFFQNCITIGKTEFDLTSNVDSNVSENYCFLQHSDPLVPSVSLESELASAVTSSSQQASGMQAFTWRVKADVLTAGTTSNIITEAGSRFFEAKTEGLPGNEGFVWTPEAPDASGIIIDDSVKKQNKIRFWSIHPMNIETKDQNKAFIKGTSISVQFRRDPISDINVPCSVSGCTWAYSKFETPCPVLGISHCTASYFDIPLTSDVSRIGANISNPNNESFILFEVFGDINKIVLRTDYNSFKAFSEWRNASVIKEAQIPTDLGPLNFSLAQIQAQNPNPKMTIVDVNLLIDVNTSRISAWVKGEGGVVKAFAKYNGIGGLYPIIGSGSSQREVIPFSIFSTGWKGEDYTIFNVNDYVRGVRQ